MLENADNNDIAIRTLDNRIQGNGEVGPFFTFLN